MSNQTGAPVYHPLKPLIEHRDEAELKAYKALAGYKFAMFGYWAGIWVHMNQCIASQDPGLKKRNPFRVLVKHAQKVAKEIEEDETTGD